MDDYQMPRRKIRFWNVSITLLVLAGLGAGGYYGYNALVSKPAQTSTTIQTATVSFGDLSQTLTVAGNLSYNNIQQITPGAAVTVKEVKVAVGDSIAKGAILATFDDASNRALQKAILQAQTALTTAQTNLSNAQHPYSDADIVSAQAAVTSAQIAVNTAQTNLNKAKQPYSNADIAQAQIAVLNAQTALATAQTNLDKAQQPYTDADIAAATTAVENAVNYYNNVCIKAQGDIADAQYKVDDAWAAYQNALLHGTPTDITRALNDYNSAKANLAIVQANGVKSMQSAWDAVVAARNTLAAMQADPDPAKIQQRQYELIVAQYNLDKAQATLTAISVPPDALDIQLKQQQLTIAQNNLVKAQQTLTAMQAGADSTTIQLKQIDVDNAQAALDLAKTQAQNNAIIAPSAGTITTVNIKTGQSIGASAVAIEMADASVFALTASVSELDIAQLKVGQSASVSIDAFYGQKFTGKLNSVATTATTSQGVVSYRVTVLVTAKSGFALMSGMSSSADITVQQATHVLIVPNKAIGGTTSDPNVTVMVDGQPQIVSITTGISDGSYTEVKQGITDGQVVQIVSTVKTAVAKTTTAAKTTAVSTAIVNTAVVQTQIPGSGGSFATGSPPTGLPGFTGRPPGAGG